jgi:hypothetical protein
MATLPRGVGTSRIGKCRGGIPEKLVDYQETCQFKTPPPPPAPQVERHCGGGGGCRPGLVEGRHGDHRYAVERGGKAVMDVVVVPGRGEDVRRWNDI